MSETTGEAFIADLIASLRHPHDIQAAHEVIERWQGSTLYLSGKLGRERRVLFAVALLGSRITPADIVKRIQTRFHVSQSQAYRVYRDALERRAPWNDGKSPFYSVDSNHPKEDDDASHKQTD